MRPHNSSPVTSQCSFSSAKDDPREQQTETLLNSPNEDHQQSLDGDGSKNRSIEEDGVQQYPVARPEKQVQSSCSTLPPQQACRSSGDRGAFQESPKFDQLTKRSLISDPSQGHLESQKRYLGMYVFTLVTVNYKLFNWVKHQMKSRERTQTISRI